MNEQRELAEYLAEQLDVPLALLLAPDISWKNVDDAIRADLYSKFDVEKICVDLDAGGDQFEINAAVLRGDYDRVEGLEDELGEKQ